MDAPDFTNAFGRKLSDGFGNTDEQLAILAACRFALGHQTTVLECDLKILESFFEKSVDRTIDRA